ncbi:CamS family sex pheromone protein [Jeotgalibacillus marinus]|uniref:CamS family sex pheromone protein n=1 Tax=Jeotgalibacillus marinus TaxID=86667 RepID=A0ABV3Q452_9BACL
MKKWIASTVGVSILLGGCIPSFQKDDKVTPENGPEDESQTVIIPDFQISDEYYKTPVPFEASLSRGMVVQNIDSNYDIAEFENGLLRIAKREFSTGDYYFKEGQFLDSETVSSWLKREWTDDQLKEQLEDDEDDITTVENLGLNPKDSPSDDLTREERAKNSPEYLAQILEHNLYGEEDGQLGGVVIGLAMNSVYYYRDDDDPFGPRYKEEISQGKIEEEGQKIAQEVIKRLREISASSPDKKELAEVPITIALFKQEPEGSVIPGTFFYYASANEGENTLSDWTPVKEDYVLFPLPKADEKFLDDDTTFKNFKQDIESYFPKDNNVIGRGFYQGDKMSKLKIDISIQFYGKAEIIGYTQYVAGKIIDDFPSSLDIEVNITSGNGQEALILKEPDDTEPWIHMFNN